MRTKVLWGIGAVVVIAFVVAVVASGGGSVSGEVAGQGNPGPGEVVFEGTGTDQGPPLVHAYYRPGHHADAAFTLAIRNGVQPHHWNFGAMPPQPGLSDQDIADVTAYVRQIQDAAGIR